MGISDTEPGSEAPTQQFLTAAGERCTNCGAALGPDQHYCVSCGERRGKPRFPLTAPVAQAVAAPPPPLLEPRFGSSGVFVTGVGVLLLAMGVGVLIGYLATRNNSSAPLREAAAPALQVITVQAGGGDGTAATAASSGSKKAGAKHHHAAATAAAPLPSAKVQAKAVQAAAKVLGSSSKNLPPPTVTVGAHGSGKGYQNGHFTGNFFGGGG